MANILNKTKKIYFKTRLWIVTGNKTLFQVSHNFQACSYLYNRPLKEMTEIKRIASAWYGICFHLTDKSGARYKSCVTSLRNVIFRFPRWRDCEFALYNYSWSGLCCFSVRSLFFLLLSLQQKNSCSFGSWTVRYQISAIRFLYLNSRANSMPGLPIS